MSPSVKPFQSFFSLFQLRIKLEDSDDDADDLCTIIVALMQKDRRREKNKGMKMLTMGFAIYKVLRANDYDLPLAVGRVTLHTMIMYKINILV